MSDCFTMIKTVIPIFCRSMPYSHTIKNQVFRFPTLRQLMAKATPLRSGDVLAGLAAETEIERVAAQCALVDVPLKTFTEELLVPYEKDEVTRLIIDTRDEVALKEIEHLTIGEFRDWLLSTEVTNEELEKITLGLMPEMVAAVSKIMSNQDLILVASKRQVVTKFRNTLGLKGHFSTRLQPNHPTDDVKGVAASLLEGLLYGIGDAVIGINPATDNLQNAITLWKMMDDVRTEFNIPTQTCVLSHITTTIEAVGVGAPVDLVFQSIAGTEKANSSFGVDLKLLKEGEEAALSLHRGTVGNNVMYFETGQGSALSANAHHGVDQQTLEARAYAVAREFNPLLVNTVVGFIDKNIVGSLAGHR